MEKVVDAKEALRAGLPEMRRWAVYKRANGNEDAAKLAEILVEIISIYLEEPARVMH
jgi:hypothetical protein